MEKTTLCPHGCGERLYYETEGKYAYLTHCSKHGIVELEKEPEILSITESPTLITIRCSNDEKDEFKNMCSDNGTTMSSVLKACIKNYVNSDNEVIEAEELIYG